MSKRSAKHHVVALHTYISQHRQCLDGDKPVGVRVRVEGFDYATTLRQVVTATDEARAA